METVTIGCRLPNGYVLEVGLQTTVEVSNPHGGRGRVAQLKKLANYKRFVLAGTHAHTFKARQSGVQVPSMASAEPYINRNVPKDLWEQWKKEHAGTWVLAKAHIFEVPGKADGPTVNAATIDASAAGVTQFQPVDPKKPFIVGKNKVETLVRED